MKFVIISSNVDITVTNGIVGADKTNYASKVGNNLNIKPLWTRNAVHIQKDKHKYPSAIADWPTVRALEEKGVLTIGQESDDGTEAEEAMLAEFNEGSQEIASELSVKRRRKKSEEEPE